MNAQDMKCGMTVVTYVGTVGVITAVVGSDCIVESDGDRRLYNAVQVSPHTTQDAIVKATLDAFAKKQLTDQDYIDALNKAADDLREENKHKFGAFTKMTPAAEKRHRLTDGPQTFMAKWLDPEC
jgi:hypothetical protein